jgi:hypothetical protein
MPRRLLCEGGAMARKRRKKARAKTTLGLREKVAIRAVGARKWRIFTAKLDTGALWSRIGARKAAKLGLGPILDVVRIKTSGGGRQNRVLVPASLRIGSCRIAALFSVSMRRPGVLIGTRTMSSRFVVDPKQRYLAGPPSLK